MIRYFKEAGNQPRQLKNYQRRLIIVTFTLLWGFFVQNVHAVPTGFIDRGDITTHIPQGLDWLDVTRTVNRGYTDIANELASGTGLGAGGWRFATDEELQIMLSSYFNISFMGGPFSASPFGPGQNPVVNEFISIFGDTLQSFLALSPGDVSSNSLGLLPLASTSGYTNGYLLSGGSVSATGRFVFDYEITRPNGSPIDFDDAINAFRTDANMPFTDLGAWLVRATMIPEPTTLALMLLGLAVISMRPAIAIRQNKIWTAIPWRSKRVTTIQTG